MNPGVLMIVTADPRESHRAAEALRIAAGVGTWQKVAVTVYLRGEAILALGETAGLVNEEDYARYWAMLAESRQPVYVERNSAALQTLDVPAMQYTEISDAELADLAAQQKCVLRF